MHQLKYVWGCKTATTLLGYSVGRAQKAAARSWTPAFSVPGLLSPKFLLSLSACLFLCSRDWGSTYSPARIQGAGAFQAVFSDRPAWDLYSSVFPNVWVCLFFSG